MQTRFTTVEGLQIRYAQNEWKWTENILFLSPLPESILAFDQVWNTLTDRFNLLAIDMPGYGQSESRTSLFSCSTMPSFLVAVMDHFNFTSPHIVGPDIGTPIALFTAGQYPQKLKSIVVSSGACIYPLMVTGVLKQIIDAPDLSVFREIPEQDIINGSLSDLRNYSLPEEIRADYIDCYKDGRLFDALQILRNFPRDLQILDPLLDTLLVPAQIIWGEDDPIAPVDNATVLNDRLPKSKLDMLPTGHYVWEDHAAHFAALTDAWVAGGYLNV